ncbi:MAG: alpha/beta hydrolase [Nitrospira sp.]|nr:alpha/beta hydrolase [Nitrospira sp.]
MSTGQPSEDPTPRNPLMLRLLSFDPGQAVYVGRPCYHGLTKAAGCSNELWTTARYSERVVASLAAAIRRIMTEQADRQLSLFGHSGGGTLAMLLAERFPETRALVTIAGNLDTDAWTAHHGFSPLTDSLNPITRPLLHRSLVQRHYVGERDRIVPSAIVKNAAAQLGTEAIVITGFDHVCCWEERWPQILADVTATE